MRVAVTGAAGRIGSRLGPAFEGWAVTAIDLDPVQPYDADLAAFESIERDVTGDVADLADAFEGHDAVLHLAAEPSADADWGTVMGPNVDGTWRVYEAARRAGVDRVAFASSNHVTHGYNVAASGAPNTLCESPRAVTVDDPVAPSGPYGITKVAGEAIGWHVARRHGIDVVNLRIGSFLPPERLRALQDGPAPVARYHRAMYLSPRDGRDAVRRALSAPLPENPLTVNLVSANRERYLAITHAMRALGYDPRDAAADAL